jgi:predicted CoA-binding protein
MENRVRELLEKSSTIAVVGMSRDSWKPAHTVPAYLTRQGYDVIPVNPFAETILGLQCYDTLSEVPRTVQIVNIFRPSDQALAIVQEAVRRRQEKGDIDMIWLQLGIVNNEAKQLAEENDIVFVQDRCLYVEHKFANIRRTV